MIKKVIAAILQNYQNALQVGTELVEEMRKNREAFAARFRPALARMVDDYSQKENGVTVEVSNGGYMVYHKNQYLFRASLTELSERVEVKVDFERVLQYNGHHELTEEEFARCETAVQSYLISAFKKRLQEELRKELARA